MLVHRAWTMKEMEKASEHLLSPVDGGGHKFAAELLVFCREFRPTTSELKRLLMFKMGHNWAKVSAGYPENELRLASSDWDNDSNAIYSAAIMDLCQRIERAFPVRTDMCKISSCKPEDNESVSQYLTCLTEIHNTHIGV